MNKFKHTLRYILEDDQQSITSAGTSTTELARTFKLVSWEPNTKNIDIGGGKYERGTEYLTTQGVTNYVYDPYNRSKEHNTKVLNEQPFDTATINNVLNVIPEEKYQLEVLRMAESVVKPGGKIYVIVYEGDKSGIGRTTKAGYQHNKKTAEYAELISTVFSEYTLKNRMFTITNTKQSD